MWTPPPGPDPYNVLDRRGVAGRVGGRCALLDGVLHVLRPCCAWRQLPLDLAPPLALHRAAPRRFASNPSGRSRGSAASPCSPDAGGSSAPLPGPGGAVGLARGYEATPSFATAFFVLAAATILLRRAAKAL